MQRLYGGGWKMSRRGAKLNAGDGLKAGWQGKRPPGQTAPESEFAAENRRKRAQRRLPGNPQTGIARKIAENRCICDDPDCQKRYAEQPIKSNPATCAADLRYFSEGKSHFQNKNRSLDRSFCAHTAAAAYPRVHPMAISQIRPAAASRLTSVVRILSSSTSDRSRGFHHRHISASPKSAQFGLV